MLGFMQEVLLALSAHEILSPRSTESYPKMSRLAYINVRTERKYLSNIHKWVGTSGTVFDLCTDKE